MSREYSIPRETIRYWISNEFSIYEKSKLKSHSHTLDSIKLEISEKSELYSFILGLYLGDGNITKNKTSYVLRIVQDSRYENSIIEISNALSSFFRKKASVRKSIGCHVISIYDKNLPLYFPQHGIGKKHDRKINLNEYQRSIIDLRCILRGLWITDGSYYIANSKYERYNFTNKSIDIISIFEECMDAFGIKYTKNIRKDGIYRIQIQKKSEVEKMKSIVGKKS